LEHLAANSSKGCEVIRHRYYILCYQEADEQASWTAYVLEGKKLQQGNLRRTQDFREDPKVRTGSAELSDYRRSGYDRGHLVPAGDFKWDSVAMSETFYLSNMSPQLHEFNAGIWEAVERTVRAWAKAKGRLVVYTGPILRSDLKKIGRRVSVPDSFYKVVYALEGSRVQAVGFIVPHQSFPKSAVSRFMLPVSDVEKIVGIDFFPELPDPIEVKAERHVQQGFWFSSP
jgi:endonuclease G